MTTTDIIQKKLNRLRSGEPPRFLDLFSGCGGISLGLTRAGFQLSGAVEVDKDAASCHSANFHRTSSKEESDLYARARDITIAEPANLIAELGLGSVQNAVDVIVGGPPCQAFARVGRAKLRDLVKDDPIPAADPRASLYERYIEYVRTLKPLAILMENVPDMLSFEGRNVAQEICETLADLGYECKYTLLNSSHFGVPQLRERMFLIGYAKGLGLEVVFPQPTHSMKLPLGYEQIRKIASNKIKFGLFEMDRFYVEPVESSPALPPAVTVANAIGDLPHLTSHRGIEFDMRARDSRRVLPYSAEIKPTAYALEMRTWPGFEAPEGTSGHITRHLPRDYPIFERMLPGDRYPEAIRHAEELLIEKLELQTSLESPPTGTFEDSAVLRKATVPPYDVSKFADKWRKLDPNAPSHTITAHLSRDTYSHIHYDDKQARTITIREAARLQSFPDGFHFSGSMNSAFKQIGNSVPPLVAYALGKVIFNSLCAIKQETPAVTQNKYLIDELVDSQWMS